MSRQRTSYVALFVLVAAAAISVACGGDKKPAEPPPTPSASAPLPPASSAPPTTSAASAAPDAGPPPSPLSTILTTDPNTLAPLLAAAASAAAAIMQPPGAIANDPIEAGIKATAAKYAKGMQPEGQIGKGDLKEGDHVSMMINLQAGRCYAVVGFGVKGTVSDLDLRLLAPPFYNMLSGEDTTDDNAPVIGKDPQSMCPAIPVALPYKVDIHAQKGAGKVGVQLYSKAAK